jgi:hypothetical protein
VSANASCAIGDLVNGNNFYGSGIEFGMNVNDSVSTIIGSSNFQNLVQGGNTLTLTITPSSSTTYNGFIIINGYVFKVPA